MHLVFGLRRFASYWNFEFKYQSYFRNLFVLFLLNEKNMVFFINLYWLKHNKGPDTKWYFIRKVFVLCCFHLVTYFLTRSVRYEIYKWFQLQKQTAVTHSQPNTITKRVNNIYWCYFRIIHNQFNKEKSDN